MGDQAVVKVSVVGNEDGFQAALSLTGSGL